MTSGKSLLFKESCHQSYTTTELILFFTLIDAVPSGPMVVIAYIQG